MPKKKNARDKRVEEEDLLEETMTDSKFKKKSKKSNKSYKKSKRNNKVPDDFEDFEDRDDDEVEEEELLSEIVSNNSKSKNRSKKKRNEKAMDDEDRDNGVYDDSMLDEEDQDNKGGETKSKSKKKKKSNKKSNKKGRKGVTIGEENNQYYDDNDDGAGDNLDSKSRREDEEDDYSKKKKSSKKSKKSKKKSRRQDDDDDDEDLDNRVMDDEEEWYDEEDEDRWQSSDEDREYDDVRRSSSDRRRRRRRRGQNRDDNDNDLDVTDAEILVPGETPRDDSPEMRLLNRFRLQLRQVGAHSDSKGFIAALHNHFVGVGRDRHNQIKQGEFRERLKEILKDTEISQYDIKRLMDILDRDGNGVIDWDEFVSFLSFPSKEMKKLVISLRKKMLRSTSNNDGKNNFENLYNQLLDNSDRKKGGITLPKLQNYIISTLNVKLTPGETAELFRQIDVNNEGLITQSSLANFLKKNTHDLLAGGEFDDSYPIVDVAVSISKTDEQNLRHLGYHKINENLNEGTTLTRPNVYLWWRSASADDYDTEMAFLKDRVTDIIVSTKNRDSMLLAEGFTCLDKSVSKGAWGGHSYIWIRKDPKDHAPVLNIAVTTGKSKRPNDKVHFPPFYGFKLTEPEHNLNGKSFFGKDVFLWYRKKTFGVEKKRGKAGETKHGSETALLAAIAVQVKKAIRDSFVDCDGQVDLEKAFQECKFFFIVGSQDVVVAYTTQQLC